MSGATSRAQSRRRSRFRDGIMPREPSRDLRQEAERRVEQRFAQQSEALFASQKEQRERDLCAQRQAVERVAQEQARIADNKRQMLEQHERNGTRCATA